MSKPLDVEVREMLMDRKGAWRDIAEASGVSYSWISKFVNNKIPNPGIVTLNKIRDVARANA